MFTVTLTECGTGKKESWFVTQKAVERAIQAGYSFPYYAILAAIRKGWGADAEYKRDTAIKASAEDIGIYIRVHLLDKGTVLPTLYRASVKRASTRVAAKRPESYLRMDDVPAATRDFLWRVCTALKLKDHTHKDVADAIGICQSTYLKGIRTKKPPKTWIEKLTTAHLLNPEYLRTGEGLPYLAPAGAPYKPDEVPPCEE